MKGLILSGGKGTRLRPLTFTQAKQLIPVANKPVLFYAVEDLLAVGIEDIGVVISPETGGEVQEALRGHGFPGVRFTFILQEKPLGLAHAVKVARPFLGEDPFVMYLGDNLLSGGLGEAMEAYRRQAPDGLILLASVENPQAFGVAVLDGAGRVRRLVEKPSHPPSSLALVGVYILPPEIHGVIEGLHPSPRGEYEITEAIQGLIDSGLRIEALQVRGWWKDTGKPEDLLEANRLVLSRLTGKIEGEVRESQLAGEVVVEKGAKVVRSRIRGPVHIAAGAVVEDSYVGPYTSIGREAVVRRSEVEYSILLDRAKVEDLPHLLDASILGREAVVVGKGEGPRRFTAGMVLGDRSQVRV
ncbi:glucose-1-phosphate thymidylyltransferase [Thermus caldilimi]|uniref:glucose-1-phosphate thymidylyltransferase n=1 Tax=Thermus caldilimi TaxID=2483360 RepID=UPI0010763BBF|nr:glucose-1-phosphate thymidylyltransferase [Thermus caldilimi]